MLNERIRWQNTFVHGLRLLTAAKGMLAPYLEQEIVEAARLADLYTRAQPEPRHADEEAIAGGMADTEDSGPNTIRKR